MSRRIGKIGSPSSQDGMIPDIKDSKKTRSILVGFPIFASKMNTQLIEGILKSKKGDKTTKKGV